MTKAAADLKALRGEQVAVAFNRHECDPGRPSKKGEKCFSIRSRPSSSSPVLGYAREVWLEDVSFFTQTGAVRRIQQTEQRTVCCFVVGTVLAARPARITQKKGWTKVRLDLDDGCFTVARSGACVRTARYCRLHQRKIEAFGYQRGASVGSLRELNPASPVFMPRRESWRGEMGGLNYEVVDAAAVVDGMAYAWSQLGDVVLLEGTDDWHAPPHVRTEIVLRELEITPIAWWHTGVSGSSHTGAFLTRRDARRFRRRYRRRYGYAVEHAGRAPGLQRPPCGCWRAGEGLALYERSELSHGGRLGRSAT